MVADVSDTTVNSDIFVGDVKTAINGLKKSKKRPHTTAIWQYLSNKLASNIDEDYTSEILKDLVNKKILVNKRDVVLSDTEPEINKDCKTSNTETFFNVDLSLDSITIYHIQFNS